MPTIVGHERTKRELFRNAAGLEQDCQEAFHCAAEVLRKAHPAEANHFERFADQCAAHEKEWTQQLQLEEPGAVVKSWSRPLNRWKVRCAATLGGLRAVAFATTNNAEDRFVGYGRVSERLDYEEITETARQLQTEANEQRRMIRQIRSGQAVPNDVSHEPV